MSLSDAAAAAASAAAAPAAAAATPIDAPASNDGSGTTARCGHCFCVLGTFLAMFNTLIDCPSNHAMAHVFCSEACYNHHLTEMHPLRHDLKLSARQIGGALRPVQFPLVVKPCTECMSYTYQLSNHHAMSHTHHSERSMTPPLTQLSPPAAVEESPLPLTTRSPMRSPRRLISTPSPAADMASAMASYMASSAVDAFRSQTPRTSSAEVVPAAAEAAAAHSPTMHTTQELCTRMDRIERKLDDLIAEMRGNKSRRRPANEE